ncbi:outer membrane protein assembly factor [Cereibacter sphaeroides]|uniref:autotransporter assembly complex protein TamA n=1 Tax=Cereibacter sphaeroides TaxID=1063 RepID=UPI000F520453|nr:autotransporter assembly complex family protein [Cereibacter sphaeroides]AZB53991.1 outer membrane protein assembly factor [Cereibacter sphaeroides]AZB58250.1 outer membrane protein assembly factor [Cereibacter sphaeroides]
MSVSSYRSPSLRAALVLLAIAAAAPQARALDRLEFRVAGSTDEVEEVIKGASALIAARAAEDSETQDIFSAARSEYGRLVTALYGLGYYSPVVSVLVDGREAAQIPPLDAPETIGTIIVQVQVGPPFRFGAARVAPLAPETKMPDGFRTGERARSTLVQDAVSAAADGWRSAGFAKVDVGSQTVVADHARRTLDADVRMAPGPRLRFGDLRINGEQRMSERRIRKIANLPTGETYDPEELADSADRLRRTGVFRSVSLTEDETVTAPDLLGITATVVEELPRRYSFGVEVSSLEGATISGQWIHRNLLGGGERLTVTGEVDNLGASNSGVDYRLGVTLDRPATPTADTTLGFGVLVERLDEEDYLADTVSLSTTLTRLFSKRLTGSLGVGYTYSDVEDDFGSYVYEYVSLPGTLVWNSRDNDLNPTEGFYVAAGATPFAGMGDTGSGGQLTLDSRAFVGFGNEDRPFVLAGRLQAGAVLGPELIETPRNYLFYSGGGGTVRGQPYQSLGVRPDPTDPDYKIGGTRFAAVSAELRAPITRRIGVVAFADAGYVTAEDIDSDRDDWHAGAGLGLRYDTGFGPIRVDVAAPVGGDTGDGVQIYVGIGQAF